MKTVPFPPLFSGPGATTFRRLAATVAHTGLRRVAIAPAAAFALFILFALFTLESHGQGMTVFNNSCSTNGTGCHAFPPSGSMLNAANASAVIVQANNTHGMGFSAGFMTANAGNIATYFGTLITGSQTVNVNYHATVGFTVNDLVLNSAGGGIITTINQVSAPARGNMLGSGTASVSYQHTANNCTSDSFQVRGQGLSNTSNRTINVTVNAPSAPVATSGSTTIAYSTSAQSINLQTLGLLSGTTPLNNPSLGTPNPNVGVVSGSGPTTLTYTANAVTHAASVAVPYSVNGPCGTSSATRTLTINVTAPPAPSVADVGPLAVPYTGTTPIDLTASITGVTASNPAATYNLVASQPTVPGSGTTSVLGNIVTYTPSGTFSGLTTFTYTKAGPGGVSNVGTVTLNVAPPPAVTTFSGPSATGTGTISAGFTGGGAACTFNPTPQYIPVSGHVRSPPAGSAPGGITFPHGLFDFTTTSCTAASTITMTVTYPNSLPTTTQYWKYGPTPTDPTPHWYILPASIAGNTATFTITDGQLGDDDLAANGTIVDQGGPGSGGSGAGIPTLSEWAILMLGMLMLVFADMRRVKNATCSASP
jgi:hypothetical protein